MADILKVTAPLINKNTIPSQRPTSDPSMPFQLGDVQALSKTAPQSELLGQNNTLNQQDEGAALLMGMLKDPGVTVQFLTSFFMLEEVIGLLPLNNSPITEEINRMFTEMLLTPDQIQGELLKQEFNSTGFKGALFDFLRELAAAQPQLAGKMELTGLLKALNGAVMRESVATSTANGLLVLSTLMGTNNGLSQKLLAVSDRFRTAEAFSQFHALRQETLPLLREAQRHILFSPKAEKTISIITYNLSRFQDNSELIRESLQNLTTLVNGVENKGALRGLVVSFLKAQLFSPDIPDKEFLLRSLADLVPSGELDTLRASVKLLNSRDNVPFSSQERLLQEELLLLKQDPNSDRERLSHLSQSMKDFAAAKLPQRSQVMGALADILARDGEDLTVLAPEKLNRVIHSLLSSPSNFTPLLHFVLPVEQQGQRAFAELWIDPNDYDEPDAPGRAPENGVHMLITFDISGIGRFEAEIWAKNERLTLTLLCPEAHVAQYAAIVPKVSKLASSIGYRFERVTVDRLARGRSLIEVFKSLPYKRAGVNVKV